MIFKNKKGVSAMVGYILLISIVIVISVLVYQWMKTYIPSESLKCPDGTSITITEASYKPVGSVYELTVKLKNTGRFNIAGYFIKAAESSEEIATIDLSAKIKTGGTLFGNNGILFAVGNENPMKPNDEKTSVFTLNSTIASVEIIPTRFQDIENRKKFAICGDAKAKEDVTLVTS
jgi:hypothetical protein